MYFEVDVVVQTDAFVKTWEVAVETDDTTSVIDVFDETIVVARATEGVEAVEVRTTEEFETVDDIRTVEDLTAYEMSAVEGLALPRPLP
jgi:hypothetical protein